MAEHPEKRSAVVGEGSLRGPEALRLFLQLLREEGFLLMYPGKHPRADAHNLALRLAEKRIVRKADISEFERHILNFLEDSPLETISETQIQLSLAM